jgi:hypothetical protein
MLATSSSDEDDYDRKKGPRSLSSAAPQSRSNNASNQLQNSSFLSTQKHGGFGTASVGRQQPVQQQQQTSSAQFNTIVNGMVNMGMNGGGSGGGGGGGGGSGGDNRSMRSSFSSSENVSLSNFQGSPMPNALRSNNVNNQSQASFNRAIAGNSMRNASFKSTSSAGTMHNANNSLAAPNSQLNTPRMTGKKQTMGNKSKQNRRMPKRPGDTASVTISLNDDNDYENEEDSDDNSDYTYERNYPNNATSTGGGGGSDDDRSDMFISSSSNNANMAEGNESIRENSLYHLNNNSGVAGVTGSGSANDGDSDSLIMSSARYHHKSKARNYEQEQHNSAAAAAAAALEAQQNEALKELEMHKKRLQIYVFVCRCIAYPFIAKQPTDLVRRQLKITKQQLQQIKDNFESFLQAKLNIEADEAFTNAVRSYYEVFLKSDRIGKMVAAGGCSVTDFRDVFKNNIEKRVRSLPEIDGLSKETVLTSWMTKFDAIFRYNEEASNTNAIANRRHSRNHMNAINNALSSESILSKEQLYDMFQNVLGIKKFEHQLIFNAAQVNNLFLFLFF